MQAEPNFVASSVVSKLCKAIGGRQRLSPTGASAYGMPWNVAISPSVLPLIFPTVVSNSMVSTRTDVSGGTLSSRFVCLPSTLSACAIALNNAINTVIHKPVDIITFNFMIRPHVHMVSAHPETNIAAGFSGIRCRDIKMFECQLHDATGLP